MQLNDLDNDNNNVNLLEASVTEPRKMPLTYIRAATSGEGEGFAVCSEKGDVLACFKTHEAAYFTAKQFRLVPLSVH